MRKRAMLVSAAMLFASASAPLSAETTEVLKNDKVVVLEVKLAPGEQEMVTGRYPSVVVYLSGDEVEMKTVDGMEEQAIVERGKTVNVPARSGVLKNTGSKELRLVRVEFLTAGSQEMWGMTGLPPNYKMIFEDEHSRTYDIKIARHEWEAQHTHHDRAVVCLSGARLEHVLPDGSVQPSTLKTDEVDWRQGQTHKGHNLGDTDLWVIAIEPK